MSCIKLPCIKPLIFSASSVCALILLFVPSPAFSKIQHEKTYLSGKKTYMYYCSRCHGTKANGHGRVAALYIKLGRPRPSNFTAGIYAQRPEGYLRSIIIDGGGSHKLSEFMPPFGGELSETQVDDVIHFIRTTSRLHKVITKKE